jgi:signal transduction histidine kinase
VDGLSRLRERALSIRGRTTALAVALVGIAMLIGAVALVGLMRWTLAASVAGDARLRAAEVAAQLSARTDPADVSLGSSDDILLQVLDAEGSVVAAGALAPATAMATGLGDGDETTIEIAGDDDPFLVAAVDAATPDGLRTVLVARNLDLVEESTALVGILLAIGLPLLLLVVGMTAWILVGRALAPVEAMRREVEEITSSELHRRVPGGAEGDEIARLGATMNDMLARLERAYAQQRQLVADTSHELRSPIATIRQHAEVALAHPDSSSLGHLAETVQSEAERLGRLVDDLLMLARLDERGAQLDRRPVDLDDLVLEAAHRFRVQHRLEVDASEVSAGRVAGDAQALRRLVDNLADNATRHARGRVAFGLRTDDAEVVLQVDDDGQGIPTADRVRIFERFVRLDASRARDAGGSGLGLSIVAEVVAAHDGTVSVGDSPLGGARIEVRLPAVEA